LEEFRDLYFAFLKFNYNFLEAQTNLMAGGFVEAIKSQEEVAKIFNEQR
jgi:hypothetical protein